MRSESRRASMCLAAGKAASGSGSALLRLPQRLGGAIWSRYAAMFLQKQTAAVASIEGPAEDSADAVCESEPSGGVQSLVDEMLARGRYALLLRPQLVGNLTAEQMARTREALSDGMCLMPAGEVAVSRAADDPDDDSDFSARGGSPLHVEAYYLDRYPVTNAEFRQFVQRGGYEQMAIWDQEIWPAVLDFVDQTGHPGPRYWRNGRCAVGEENHPVVGVCWYEAAAYSRWVGKRLATDAEWVKAGSWPVALVGRPLVARRFPWGDAMDRSRANLWGSGPSRIVGVDQFAGGVSVGGVHQLIGNVWEWTADWFTLDGDSRDSLPMNMKSIRGGAFDTYLDNQATCHFQSGEQALARKHNIGFRAAIGLHDLAPCDERAPCDDHVEPCSGEQHELSIAETPS